YGKRIFNGLSEQGFKVQVLQDKKWYTLSNKIKIMCLTDIYQDAILLVDINGRLMANLNDASRMLIWHKHARRIIKGYDKSFILALTGHGDAEMINFRTEEGELIPPVELEHRDPILSIISSNLSFFGAKAFIPFSSMHRYQRTDSIWAEDVSVKMEEFTEAHMLSAGKSFPAFIRYNCIDDSFEEINPKKSERVIYEPEQFGDNWTDVLSAEDVRSATRYFQAVESLKDYWDYIILSVGKKEHVIDLNKGKTNVGVTFEAPRNSLMFSIENNIFEDMLIGNFMKTTWHNKEPQSRMYPDTLPLVKYADNGLAYTKDEVERYMSEYRRRYLMDSSVFAFQNKCVNTVRSLVSEKSGFYPAAQKAKRLLFGRG
ncbi:MAG: MBL fold metallo-hydrolase, partial [Bacteroidia bacterium]